MTSVMSNRSIVRYMREFGYTLKPGASPGNIVFRKSRSYLVFSSWAKAERFILHHPKMRRAQEKLRRHSRFRRGTISKRRRMQMLVKAGVAGGVKGGAVL